ncbi:hypothetical protein NQZ79_g7588 [Umbelopsis isabellina]|nr:hypothetical protein NQZ79_g7588 [Umbelopsis isabellina]
MSTAKALATAAMEWLAKPLAGQVRQKPLGCWSRRYMSTTSLASSTCTITEGQNSLVANSTKKCSIGTSGTPRQYRHSRSDIAVQPLITARKKSFGRYSNCQKKDVDRRAWQQFTIRKRLLSGSRGLALHVYASMGFSLQDDKSKQQFFQLLNVSEIMQLLSALRQQSANTAEHELQQHAHHVQRLDLLLQHLQYRLKCIDYKITENALEILGRAGETELAEDIFKQYLENGGAPQVGMFNKLMMVYLHRIKRQGLDKEERTYFLERLERIWENIGKLSDSPDTYSYNTFLTAKVLAGDIDGAENVFQEMKVPPDRVSFHILLNGYLKAIDSKQQQRAETWLSQMISHGIQPDTKTFNTLMSGLVNQMRRSDSQTIGTTANTVLKLADAMKSLGVEKDKYSVAILLGCHSLSGNIGQIDRIAADLRLIRSNGEQAMEERDTSIATAVGVLTDMYIYNNLINIYLGVGHDDKAMNIYHEMVQKGMKADVVTFGTLIRHSIKRGDVPAAFDYYDKMQQAGISENMHIRNMLVSTFATNEVPGRIIESVIMTGCLLAQKLSNSQTR